MLAALLLLAAATAQSIPITGQVLETGRPCAGARVELYTVHQDNPVQAGPPQAQNLVLGLRVPQPD